MKYGDIINHVYQYFIKQGKKICGNDYTGYYMKSDVNANQDYFINEENLNQIVIGSIKNNNISTFMCLGIINVNGLEVTNDVFFCRIAQSTLGQNKKSYYMEQGIVKLKDSDIEKYTISEELLSRLQKRSLRLYELFLNYDMYNFPPYLGLLEKHIYKMIVENRELAVEQFVQSLEKTEFLKTSQIMEEQIVKGYDFSEECALTPLSDHEKEILGFIYSKTEEYKKLAESEIKTEMSDTCRQFIK